MDQIRPSADLRNKYKEIASICKETRNPVFITVNGRGDTVLLGLAEYNQMKAELDLLRMLSLADEDVYQQRIKPIEETFTSILQQLKKK